MKRVLLYLYTLFFCGTSSFSYSFQPSSNIHEILLSIPAQDVETLEKFFKTLFIQGGFAFTLLGKKPMVCIDYNLENIRHVLPDKKNLDSMAAVFSGGKVWEKYKKKFCFNQFEFFNYTSQDYKTFGFVLINKEAVRDLFEQNKDLFKTVFGDRENLSQIFRKAPVDILPKGDLKPKFHHAFGVILGYGDKNSMAFGKRDELVQFLGNAPINLNCLNAKDANYIIKEQSMSYKEGALVSIDYSHEKINDAIQTLNSLHNNYHFTLATERERNLSPIDLPGFLAFSDDKETDQIKKSYDSIRSQIIEILYSKNFLETVLTFLTL